jgi:hypothetical protein
MLSSQLLFVGFIIVQALTQQKALALFTPALKVSFQSTTRNFPPVSRQIFGSSGSNSDLDGELDKFFELAAESGYENIKNMTPEERVERVIRGEQLENEIFDLRSELMMLEDDIMAGKQGIDVAAVKEMRLKMNSLKTEYKDIVGAKDLPLYFGRLPDSMQ